MLHLFWWISGLGTLGIVGLIALWFFAPAVASLILRWFAAFAKTAVGMISISLIVGFLVGMDYQKYADAVLQKRAEAQAELMRQARDKKAEELVDATSTLDDLQNQLNNRNKLVTDYENVLKQATDTAVAKSPGDATPVKACDSGVIGPDVDVLRDIAGVKGQPAKRVRKIRLPVANPAH